jgi:hypothetical protein
MRDELFDRDFQAARADFFAGIERLAKLVADGLRLLHRKQWDAPWKKAGGRKQTGIA